jgi:GTP-binding protein
VIADTLRKLNKPVILVTNKTDGIDSAVALADFYSLGLGELQIGGVYGCGIAELLQKASALLPHAEVEDDDDKGAIAIAIVGRPNVGKSTLVNRLLGEERVIVYDQAGTTRDSIYIPFERNGKKFTLIDTAGMRRRSRVEEVIEKFSVLKALQAIDKANVVIYLIDA